jgi:hypothetical protein
MRCLRFTVRRRLTHLNPIERQHSTVKYLFALLLVACANNQSVMPTQHAQACGQQDVFLSESQLFVNYYVNPIKLTPPYGSYTYASVTNDLQTSPITVYLSQNGGEHQVKPGDTFDYTYPSPLPFLAIQQDLDALDLGTGVALSMTYCPSKS